MTWTNGTMTVGTADDELDKRLSTELTAFNVAATGQDNERSLRIRALDEGGELAGGLRGWTWGTCAGVDMLWVRDDRRRGGLGRALMESAEAEARQRGCVQLLVNSFTFQAPDFYRRLGYVEFARSEGLPVAGRADVHFRKDL